MAQGSPVTLTSGPGIKVPAALLRLGANFALVYIDSADSAVKCMFVDPFGRVRTPPKKLNLEGTAALLPSAAATKKGMVVTWPQKTTSGEQIMTIVLNAQGNPLGAPYPLTEPGRQRPAAAAAAAADSYGAAWIEISSEGRMLFFSQLDDNGRQVGEPIRLSKPRPVRVMSNRLALEADNNGNVIAWVDVAPPMNSEIILSRVSFQDTSGASSPKMDVKGLEEEESGSESGTTGSDEMEEMAPGSETKGSGGK